MLLVHFVLVVSVDRRVLCWLVPRLVSVSTAVGWQTSSALTIAPRLVSVSTAVGWQTSSALTCTETCRSQSAVGSSGHSWSRWFEVASSLHPTRPPPARSWRMLVATPRVRLNTSLRHVMVHTNRFWFLCILNFFGFIFINNSHRR